MARHTRRAFVAAGVAGLASGCLRTTEERCSLPEPASVGDGWHRPRRDATNAATAPSGATPDPESLSTEWEWTRAGEVVDYVVADGQVVCTGRTPVAGSGGANPTLHSLDVTSGEARWERPIPGASGPAVELSPPFYADGRVYASTTDPRSNASGTVTAFDASDGAIDWQTTPVGAVEIATVARGLVLVRTETGLAALHQSDGRQCWAYEPGAGRTSDGARRRVTGRPALLDHVLVATITGSDGQYGFAGIDATTGTQGWRRDLGSSTFPPQYPVVNDALVVVPGRESVLGLSPIDGTTMWETGAVTGDPDQFDGITATNSQVVASGRRLYGLDARDGTVQWDRSAEYRPPTVGGEYVFGVVGRDDGTAENAVAVRDLATGEPVGSHPADADLLGRVSVAAGRLFVRTQTGERSDEDVTQGIRALS